MASKYYVVWEGKRTGVFESWDEVKRLINGYPGAKYKSFINKEEAERAYKNPETVVSKKKKTKSKYYVIWDGENSGIYTDWSEAQQKLKGIPKERLKTFGSRELAEKALLEGHEKYIGKDFRKTQDLSKQEIERIGNPLEMSLSVDAACNSMTGLMEYQGVWTFDKENVLFKKGPYKNGTNNIGEFLALVHALALFQKNPDPKFKKIPIYSDSKIAMTWIKAKKCRTKASPNPELTELIRRAEKWLIENSFQNPILKWETKVWGEIPADFGRK